MKFGMSRVAADDVRSQCMRLACTTTLPAPWARSHALDGADAEQIEGVADDPGRQVGQEEPAPPQLGRFRLQHGAVDEEAAERLRKVPEVSREVVRQVLRHRGVERLRVAEQLQR